VVCRTLIGEFEATPRKHKIARLFPPADVDGYVTVLSVCSQMGPDPSPVPRVCRDPEDDYRSALAVESGVDRLLGDLQRLRGGGPSPERVARVHRW